MNYVDGKFYPLIQYLRKLSKEDIFENIKYHFEHLDRNTQVAFEKFFDKFDYWGSLHSQLGDYEEIKRRTNSIYEHLEDFVWLYERLGDYRSKKMLYAILSNWYRYDFKELKECFDNTYPDYFDLDLVSCDEQEVFVDLGAFTGDTVLSYLKMYQERYQKIYCYEVTEESFWMLKKNLCYYPNIEFRKKAVLDQEKKVSIERSSEGLSANKVVLNVRAEAMDKTTNSKNGLDGNEDKNEEIEAVCLDQDIQEKITMIKMDIEGSEMLALLGCKRHIQEEQPKLLLSVYHNHEDIWKIPRMIDEMQKGYRFYLRYHGGGVFPTEVTLIAIHD